MPLESGVRFDITGTGIKHLTGWVASHDGLLVRDLDHDGVITSGKELFGEATYLKSGSRATDGFAALNDEDENHDGKIDSQDRIWQQLLIWRDEDSDAETDTGELMSLGQVGVVSIALEPSKVSWWQAGHEVRLESNMQLQDGGSLLVVDVWFRVQPMQDTGSDD